MTPVNTSPVEVDPPVRTALPPAPRPMTGSGLSLRANFAWTLAGNVVYAGCQWGMLVALARLGSPQMVGQFALGLALTAPVLMFANLDLRAAQATDARGEFAFAEYLGLRLLTTALALVVIAALVAAGGYGLETAAVVLLVGLAKAAESVSDILFGLLQQKERMDRIALSQILRGLLSLILLGGTIILTGTLVWATAALAAAWLVLLASFDIPNAARLLPAGGLQPRWHLSILVRLGRLALPLGAVMFLISFNTNLPRYFVEGELGLHELGLFSALVYLSVAGGTVGMALGHAAYPRLARHYATGLRRAYIVLLLQLLGVSAVIGLSCVVGAVVVGRPLLQLLYGPEYGEQQAVLVWVMAAAATGYLASTLNFGLTAARYFLLQALLLVIVTISTAAACAVLVPRHGLEGAAQAMLVGALVQLTGAGLCLGVLLTRKEGTRA